MSVGVVQEYYKNTVTLGKENTVEEKNEHVLAYVVWKKRHTHWIVSHCNVHTG